MPDKTELKRSRRLFRLLKVLMLLAAAHLLAGCEVTRIFIIADPDLASLATGETLEITAVVTGTNNRDDKAVVWLVCNGDGQSCVSGGNSSLGTISPTSPDSSGNLVAIYTAPSSQPSPPACTQETDGCSVVVKGQMVNFEAACFTRVKILGATNPVPAIGTITPDTVTVGGADFTLTVDGADFIASSVVQVDGSDRATTFIDSTTLEATVLAADIATAGTANVTVFNPTPGGGTSNPVVLSINNPAPAITTLTPSNATEGGAAFTLTVDGTDFLASSVVRWNGSDRTTTFVSSVQLTSDIPASDIATVGTADVTVFNPTPGGGTSNLVTFTINAATPGAEERISVATDGTQADGGSIHPVVNTDGRFVAFKSAASNLVANDTNGFTDIFLRDTCRGTTGGCTPSTIRVSVATDGTEANDHSNFGKPSISADGRFVAFDSPATNLVSGDANGAIDVFVRDTCIGAAGGCTPNTVRVSVAGDGTEANGIAQTQP